MKDSPPPEISNPLMQIEPIASRVTEITVMSWYVDLIQDLKQLIETFKDSVKELAFQADLARIECYHSLGVRILAEKSKFEKVKIRETAAYQLMEESIGVKERTIQRAVQFAKKMPDLQGFLAQHGKDVSWREICNKYLPVPTKPMDLECQHTWVEKCSKCGIKKEM